MICIISLIVFSVLGVFSARYRSLAKEAFSCLRSTVTRSPCDTQLDERVQASLVGRVLSFSPRLGRLLNNHFRIFSWLVLAIFVVSAFFAGQGIYNWAIYGNCDGEDADSNCTFDKIINLTAGITEPIANETTSDQQHDTVDPP